MNGRFFRRRFYLAVAVLLLSLIIVVTLAGTCIHRGLEQRRAVQCLAAMGGEVSYRPHSLSSWRCTLGQFLGEDLFLDVYTVEFRAGAEVTPAAIGVVKRFPYIDTLTLRRVQLDCQVLQEIALLANLTSLSIIGCEVNDSCLSYLADMRNIQHLELCDTKLDDSDLRGFNGFVNLVVLTLSGTHITDAGLAYLSRCQQLEILALDGTGISDRGLVHLYNLHRLVHLDLSNTEVSADGINSLKHRLPAATILWRHDHWPGKGDTESAKG